MIDAVERVGTGYAFRGTLLVRRSYREAGVQRPFRCAVSGEGVRDVQVEGLAPVAG